MTKLINKKMCRAKHVPMDQRDRIVEAFQQDGYVVVTDALTPEEVERALEELWTSPRLLGRPGLDRRNPETWESSNWPQSDGGRNFFSSSDPFLDTAPWELCSNRNVVEIQRLLYQNDQIMADGIGRWGIMRPTANHPEWKTDSSWLHWDQNPWTEPDFSRIQAIVCLTDNTETSGGFACVPGFHHEFQAWGKEHPMGSFRTESGKVIDQSYGRSQPFPIPATDPCQDRVVRVLAPAGSLVIWDSRLPHQNFPNTDSSAIRIVHYTMMKIKDEESVQEHRDWMEKKAVVMNVLGHEGGRFPNNLSEEARVIHCLLPREESDIYESVGIDNGLREAIQLVREAGELEEIGNFPGAIRKHKASLRAYPDIESWHRAILE